MNKDGEQIKPGAPSSAKELYSRYAASVIAVVTVDLEGDQATGSAFHVGDGVFVTARHVVEGMASFHVEYDRYRVWHRADEAAQAIDVEDGALIPIDPRLHSDPKKAVAVFCLPQLSALPAIPLGGHLDD